MSIISNKGISNSFHFIWKSIMYLSAIDGKTCANRVYRFYFTISSSLVELTPNTLTDIQDHIYKDVSYNTPCHIRHCTYQSHFLRLNNGNSFVATATLVASSAVFAWVRCDICWQHFHLNHFMIFIQRFSK